MKKATQIYKSLILATAIILSAGNIQAQCDQLVEPNNSLTQYSNMQLASIVTSTIGYSGDLDYLRVYASNSGILHVMLDQLPLDYDLKIYSAAGTQLATSDNGGTTADQISINVIQGSYYFIRVNGYNGAYSSSSCYRIITALQLFDCQDNYESNNTQATCKTIPVNQQVSAKISSYTDQDWFKINTTASAPNIKVILTNLPADYDISLYNANGAWLNTSSNGSTTSETIVYNNPFTVANTYYIKVYSYTQTPSNNCYILNTLTSASAFPYARTDEDPEYMEDNNVVTAMSMYPNPAIAGQLLTINLKEDATLEKISILNTNGETVSEQKIILENGKATINLEGIAPGIYILDAGEAGKQKLIVQ